MNRLRDIKRAGRLRLHASMGVPALYLPSQGAVPVPCTVRVHTKFAALGDRFDGAERAEAEPKIIFLASEVPDPRPQTGIVSVEPGKAYRIVAADPADDITITAKVARLTAAQAAGLPVWPANEPPTLPGRTFNAAQSGFGTIDYGDLDAPTPLPLPANEWVRINRRLRPSVSNRNLPRGPWKDYLFYDSGLLRGRARGDVYLYKFVFRATPSLRGGSIRFAVRPADNPAFDFGPTVIPIDGDAGQELVTSVTFVEQVRERFAASGAYIYVMMSVDGVLTEFSPEVTPLSFQP